MLNILWPIFILTSFVFGILTGRTSEINQSIFDSTTEAVQLCISLIRNYLFVEWDYESCVRNNHNRKNHKIT